MQFNPGDIVRLKDQTKFGGAWSGNMVVQGAYAHRKDLIRAYHTTKGNGGFDPCDLELVPQTTAIRIANTQTSIAEKEALLLETEASIKAAKALLKELTDIPPAVGDVYRHKNGTQHYTIELIIDDNICISWQEGSKRVIEVRPMRLLKDYWVRVV
jgi:hypothetical protein